MAIVKIKKNILISGLNILDLVLQTKLANSKNEIRRITMGCKKNDNEKYFLIVAILLNQGWF